jgi:hypothetical protein
MNLVTLTICTTHNLHYALYSLCTMHYTLCTTHYALRTVLTVHYALHTLHYTICTTQPHSALCTVLTMHTMHCTHNALHTMHYTPCTTHYALHTTHYALRIMHYTLCSTHQVFAAHSDASATTGRCITAQGAGANDGLKPRCGKDDEKEWPLVLLVHRADTEARVLHNHGELLARLRSTLGPKQVRVQEYIAGGKNGLSLSEQVD